MARIRGVCYWVSTTLQSVRNYFGQRAQNVEPVSSTLICSVNELHGTELGSSGEQDTKGKTGDHTTGQDTVLPGSSTSKQPLRSSALTHAQHQDTDISSNVCLTMEHVRGAITEKLRESNPTSKKRFLTRSSLESLLGIRFVERILNDRLGREVSIQMLAEFVVSRALSVFAILIMMDKPYLIESFYRDDFDESMLPIRCKGTMTDWSVESYFNKNSNTTLKEIFSQHGWTFSDVADICDIYQWQFFPLVFTEETFRYEIPSDMRLPYTQSVKQLKTTNSYYSCVEKRSIYHECFKSTIQTVVDDDGNFSVAVKKLKGSNEKDANKEAKALESIRGHSNAHLIKAIAFICTDSGTEYSFVFPWAQHGNLWDFWVRQGGAPRDREYFVRVFRQLACLACAIDDLSNMRLRHGDLKPENIVCFQTDEGLPAKDGKELDTMIRLVVIDVGLAKIHAQRTELRSKTNTRVSTKRYAAPELETDPYKELSRRFDVWSMGCILLEFAIWLIYGTEKLLDFTTSKTDSIQSTHETKMQSDSAIGESYSAESTFYSISPKNGSPPSSGELKQIAIRDPKVDAMISEIQENPCCSKGTAMRRLVDLISDKLLRVDLSGDEEPEPEIDGRSICKCVQGVHSVLPLSADSDSDAEQELRINDTTNPPSINKNSPSKPGRPYARAMKEELKSILAALENGSIEPIILDDKATRPA
ncbi:hypothetical protein F5Y10DRAFT_293840 [Nemania abortiva]|nr:hypothetical protein F5Y10DRAFT_293840 [Nemania abortiva]